MNEIQTQAPPPAARSPGPSTLQLIVVVVILGGGIALTALTSNVSKVSEPGVKMVNGEPFLPEKAGSWTGSKQTGLTEDERAILPSDTEGARRIYSDDKGHEIYCSIVLAGRDVTSIHRPELCLKGQGWQLAAARTVEIPTVAAQGGVLRVSRMDATRALAANDARTGQLRSEFVYWFVGKDRTTPHHWQRILWTTEDRVLHNRNHRWAYFMVNTLVDPKFAAQDPDAAQTQAMEVLRGFIQEIYPALVAS